MDWARENIRKLEPYVPGFQPKEDGFIKLNTNENPYPPSPRVKQMLGRIKGDLLRLYPDPHSDRLRQKIAEIYGFRRDNVIVGNGSDEILSIALRCFVGEGERIAFPHPSYSLFSVLGQIQGGEMASYELDDDFRLPPAFFSAGARIKLLASPNSPTGTLYPMEVIDRLAEESEGIVLVDEAYVDFAEESCLPLVRKYPHLIVVRTFSKSFGLAGARIGYAFAPEEIIQIMMKVKDSYNLNRLGALAAEAALEDWDYFRANVDKIKGERKFLEKELQSLGFYVYPSGANFLLVRDPEGRAREIYEKLLGRKILIRYFDDVRLKDCLRISIGTHEQIKQLLRALREILNGCSPSGTAGERKNEA